MDKIIKPEYDSSLYSGKVKITLKRGDTPIKEIETHNSATSEFFEYILKCVTGQNVVNERPGYIYLYTNYTSEEFNTPIINFGILYDGTTAINKSTEDDGTFATVTYHFMVPDTLISGKTLGAFTVRSLDKNNTLYAIVHLESPETISDNTNVDIE